jgi:hypothetical protein
MFRKTQPQSLLLSVFQDIPRLTTHLVYLVLDCLLITHFCEELIALSVRWMQPIQQQGRRLPSRSSSQVRRTRRFLVSNCFAFSTQQINSLRARGVISSHRLRTPLVDTIALCRSAGILCTVPPEILVAVSSAIIIYSSLFRVR